MKFTSPMVTAAICILGYSVTSVELVSAQEVSLQDVRESVTQDLNNALSRLAEQREQIASEKIPLVTELNQSESDIRQLRESATRLQAVRDSRELGLGDIRAQLEAWGNENTYLMNLFNEYASQFQSNLNVSESERYAEEISTFNSLQNSPNREQRLESQLILVENGLDRIRSSFGGESYTGVIVGDDGTLRPGVFSRLGPLAFFVDQQREIAGIVNDQDGINARIFELAGESETITSLSNGLLVEVPADVTGGRVTALSSNRESVFDHISNGGIWIAPILFFALLSLCISFYKAMQIYRVKLPAMQNVKAILEKAQSANKQEAIDLANEMPAPVGPMLVQGLGHASEPKEFIEEVLYESILETRPKLNRLLPIIATTAAVAPLLGLLGTVTGMINTFNLITLFGTGDARVLSSGISEALVTTEFGLIVAIPSLIVHAILSRRIKTILGDMEKYALIFSNGLSARSTVVTSS
jgi:biopolymer transport protein ExbB